MENHIELLGITSSSGESHRVMGNHSEYCDIPANNEESQRVSLYFVSLKGATRYNCLIQVLPVPVISRISLYNFAIHSCKLNLNEIRKQKCRSESIKDH